MRPSATTSATSLVYEALSYLAGARAAPPLLERFRFSAVGQSIFFTFFFLLFFSYLAGARAAPPLFERFRFSAVGQSFFFIIIF
jgi:hypothetical protein